MKRLLIAALLAGAALPALASAQEAEHRLTTRELRAMADRGALLCEQWDATANRCTAIYRWNVVRGEVTETRLETVANTPTVDMAFQYPVAFRDDQACVETDANATSILVMLNGQELSSEQVAPIRAAVDNIYARVAGQKICTAFFQSAPNEPLRAEVRVGASARADLNTSFKVLDGPPLPALRAQRQPWTGAVLRTIGDLQASGALPSAIPAAGSGAPSSVPATPAAEPIAEPTAAAPAPEPTAVTTPPTTPAAPLPAPAAACQPDNGRMARLRRWLRIGGDDCPAPTPAPQSR